jgi:hypothetical protein
VFAVGILKFCCLIGSMYENVSGRAKAKYVMVWRIDYSSLGFGRCRVCGRSCVYDVCLVEKGLGLEDNAD